MRNENDMTMGGLLVLGALLTANPNAAADPEREQVAMEPLARAMLETVAGYMLGQSRVFFEEPSDGGRYSFGLASQASCPNPEAGQAAIDAFQRELQVERAHLALELAPLADRDGSGLVSDAESAEFRTMLEMVLLASWFYDRHQEVPDLPTLAQAIGHSEQETQGLIQLYVQLQPEVERVNPHALLGTTFKPLDSIGLGALAGR